jgi:hypothetical protein
MKRIAQVNDSTHNRTPRLPIAARSSRALNRLVEMWSYLDLFIFLVRRDLIIRYKQIFLGIACAMV